MAAGWHLKMRHERLESHNSVLAVVVCAVATIGTFVTLRWIVELVANSGRGLDASDESLYLLAVESPHASRFAASGFDSYLGPIWWLCNHSIARFRLAGVVILIGAIAVTARLCHRVASGANREFPLAVSICFFASLASLAFSSYILWLTTPGYNFVVLVVTLLIAGMVAEIALAPIRCPPDSEVRRWRVSIETVLGFAFSVGAMVKGPAFVSIAALSGVALIVTRGPRWLVRHLWQLSTGFMLGLLVFVTLTGSPVGVVQRMLRGIRAVGILGVHTRESLWEITSMRHVYGPWFFRYLLGACVLGLLWRLVRRDDVRIALTSLGAVVTAIVFVSSVPRGGVAALGGTTGWWWVRFAAMTLFWSTANTGVLSRKLALGPLVALMAVGAAAGSSNGVIREVALTVGILGVGILVHGLVVVSLRREFCEVGEGEQSGRTAVAVLPIALFFVIGGVASNSALDGALHKPYRLTGTLEAESEAVDLGDFGTIDVHQKTAQYIHELQMIATQVPDEARDCLVDLSGGTPLTAIALGVQPASVPWIVGGYPGSGAFADYVLRGSPCLVGGFVLIEAPGGSRAIKRPSWLDTRGAAFLGQVEYDGYLKETQYVWLVPRAVLRAADEGHPRRSYRNERT